jgi:integrase
MGELKLRGKIWWIKYYRKGHRAEESSGSKNREVAKHLLKIREGDLAKCVPINAKVGQLRLEEAAADLLTDYRVNGKRSLRDVQRRIDKGLTPWFRDRRMASINTADIRAYVAQRQTAGFANATINRELAALKRMFSLAVQAGKLLHQPYIPLLAEDNVRQGFFERAQFDDVLAKLSSPLAAVATLAYYAGWRVTSEVLPLQWSQVDRTAGTLRLEPGTTKNRDGRLFKYAEIDDLRAVIDGLWDAHLELQRDGVICPWVFQRRRGKRRGCRIKSFVRAWRTACREAGCPGRIPHDFRRTAVRNLTRAGVTDTVAMKITGHKTRSVFNRYDITSEEDLSEASRKLRARQDRDSGKGQGQGTTGTISGTIGGPEAESLRERFAKSGS